VKWDKPDSQLNPWGFGEPRYLRLPNWFEVYERRIIQRFAEVQWNHPLWKMLQGRRSAFGTSAGSKMRFAAGDGGILVSFRRAALEEIAHEWPEAQHLSQCKGRELRNGFCADSDGWVHQAASEE
jgi:hypothetical protein